MKQTMNRQTLRAARTMALLAPLLLAPAAGMTDDTGLCAPREKIWFNARVAESGQLVSVCGAEIVNDEVAWVQFRMGVPGKIELAYPKQRNGSAQAFTFRRYTRYRTTYLKLGFRIGDRDYAILEYDVSDESPPYLLELRIRRASDEAVLAKHTLQPVTAPLGMMRLENYVRTAPYDE